MYICLCNGLKDTHISTAIAEGVTSVSDVYKRCGSQPQCGKCAAFILQQMKSCGRN